MELVRSQALFLHKRLVEGALDKGELTALLADVERREGHSFDGSVGAYEHVVARLFRQARELDVAVVERDLQDGQLVALTQDFYIRRDDDERGSFKAKLDSNRDAVIRGRFSTSHLIGSTGQSETFGHSRFSMLGYADQVALDDQPPSLDIRPIFIGWRLTAEDSLPTLDDRREVWPQQIDQFSLISGKRASAKDRAAVKAMSEEEAKTAFAEIVGEPFVPNDWGGETSDLSTARLMMGGEPLSAAFAFKGPSVRGKLQISRMGKNGDQALRLVHESVDLYVVQHHDAVAAEVKNLLSALARANQRRFMVIDGEATALILREYGHLSTHSSPPS